MSQSDDVLRQTASQTYSAYDPSQADAADSLAGFELGRRGPHGVAVADAWKRLPSRPARGRPRGLAGGEARNRGRWGVDTGRRDATGTSGGPGAARRCGSRAGPSPGGRSRGGLRARQTLGWRRRSAQGRQIFGRSVALSPDGVAARGVGDAGGYPHGGPTGCRRRRWFAGHRRPTAAWPLHAGNGGRGELPCRPGPAQWRATANVCPRRASPARARHPVPQARDAPPRPAPGARGGAPVRTGRCALLRPAGGPAAPSPSSPARGRKSPERAGSRPNGGLRFPWR